MISLQEFIIQVYVFTLPVSRLNSKVSIFSLGLSRIIFAAQQEPNLGNPIPNKQLCNSIMRRKWEGICYRMGMNACAIGGSHKLSMEASTGPPQLFSDIFPKS